MGVLRLVVGGDVGARHQHRRRAGDGELGAGERARAAQRHVGGGVGEVHPVEVRDQAQARVLGDGVLERVVVALAGRPDHERVLVLEDGREVQLDGAVDRSGAERAAEDEQHVGAVRDVPVGARLIAVGVLEVLADGVAGELGLGALEVGRGGLERQEHLVARARPAACWWRRRRRSALAGSALVLEASPARPTGPLA